jgi:uncharacterized short protein YbdD (DUF466 family)
MRALKRWTARCWRTLRQMTGDDAYERYLQHWQAHHAAGGGPPMDPRAFFRSELERKWNGVRRCC